MIANFLLCLYAVLLKKGYQTSNVKGKYRNIKNARRGLHPTRIIVSFNNVLVNLKWSSQCSTDIDYASDSARAKRGGPKRA